MTPVEPSHCSCHLQRLVGHRDPVKPPGKVHRQPCPQRPHQLARLPLAHKQQLLIVEFHQYRRLLQHQLPGLVHKARLVLHHEAVHR